MVLLSLGHKSWKENSSHHGQLDDFFRLLPTRGDSDRSWTITREEIETCGYDLKVVNSNAKTDQDLRKSEELLNLIESKGKEVAEALARLKVS